MIMNVVIGYRGYRSGFNAEFLIQGLHLSNFQGRFGRQVLELLEAYINRGLLCLRTRRRLFWKYSKRKVEGW